MSIALLSRFSAQLYKSIGPRAGLSIGALVTIACLFSYLLVDRTSDWILVSFIVGFGMALRWVMGETWLIASAPKYLRGRVVGIQEICIAVGCAAGPALVVATGESGQTPFLACAGIMASAGVVPLLLRAADKPCDDLFCASETEAQGPGRTVVRLAVASAFASGALETGAHAFLPTLVFGKFWEGWSPLFAASVFSCGAIVCQLPLGFLVDRIGSERIHRQVAVLLLVVGCALLWTLATPLGCLFILLGGACSAGLYTLAILSIAVFSKHMAAGVANVAIAYTVGGFVGSVTIGATVGILGASALGCTIIVTGLGLLLVQHSTDSELACGR
jgi:MFS family permease